MFKKISSILYNVNKNYLHLDVISLLRIKYLTSTLRQDQYYTIKFIFSGDWGDNEIEKCNTGYPQFITL